MPDFQQLIDNLNPAQREAVTTADGPLLVIAGAGSGKTRVITHRIAWLVRTMDIEPWRIFAATFTNKAAEEMRLRVAKLVPGSDVARLSISTFHSLCVGILRREAQHAGLSPRFTICDDADQLALIKDCLRGMSVPSGSIKPEQIRNYIAAAKILMLDPDEARRELRWEVGPIAADVYDMYQKRLMAGDGVDFDDLILHVVRIFQREPEVLAHYQHRWRYVLVDEYQDTNRVQFEFVKLLAAAHGNLCVVGDEDQSIYSWRGAEIENLLKFPEIFPGTRIVRLEQNYRSTETILRAASAVIANNRQRLGKDLWSERGLGERITMISGYNERDEAAIVVQTIQWLSRVRGLPLSEIAVFYRVNALSRVVEDQLRQAGINYRVIGGIKFYDRAEVKDLLAYLRLVVNPRDGAALARVINKPARGIGDKSVSALFQDAAAKNVSLYDALVAHKDDKAGALSGKARAGANGFITQLAQWSEYAENHAPHEVLDRILRDTAYEEALGGDRDLEAITRRENVAELVSALEQFAETDPDATLSDFLERVALVSAQDEMTEGEAVSLMTMHCAKGLEFRAVFIIGMEDPIFPSQRAVEDQGNFEEERRLFYVGITRARDLLFLSRADSRTLHGRPCYNTPSLFLREVPTELLRTIDDARREWAELNRQRAERPAMREPAPRSEPEPEIERIASGGKFSLGMRVTHERLGEGEIVGISGEGERRKISVKFDAGLEMEILERYGGLQPVESGDLPF
ncbi:UvrD-helicase domain-containing protein [bacterium]|nr:UvrD-helicase domain-containing protein [bacterium]